MFLAHFCGFGYLEMMEAIPLRELYRLHAEAVKMHNRLNASK